MCSDGIQGALIANSILSTITTISEFLLLTPSCLDNQTELNLSMDTHTLQTLFKRERQPHVFAPLGNDEYFKSINVPASHTHILDWWDSRSVDVEMDGKTVGMDITCTPCQHMTGRSLTDRFRTLWSSWAVKDKTTGKQVYFAGDTAYRTVRGDDDEEKVPTCPAFKEIGERFGGFDLALIPIGYVLAFRCFLQQCVNLTHIAICIFQCLYASRFHVGYALCATR
jgi:N-acyl-phosphatidylethanolamine-hydrolysing phospholipase D